MKPSAPDPTPALLHSTWTAPCSARVRRRELGDGVVVGHVDDCGVDRVEAVGAQLRRRVVDRVGPHVGGDDGHALLREPLHHREPDAARAAGDDGDLAAQIFHGSPRVRSAVDSACNTVTVTA